MDRFWTFQIMKTNWILMNSIRFFILSVRLDFLFAIQLLAKEVKHHVYYTSHLHLDLASKLLHFCLHCFSKFHVYEQFIDSGDITEHFTSIKALYRSRMTWKHWPVFVHSNVQSDVSLDFHRKCWSFKQWGEFLILPKSLRPSDWSL